MSPYEIDALEEVWRNGGAAALTPNEIRGLFRVLRASEAVLAHWGSTQSPSTQELRTAIDELQKHVGLAKRNFK